MGLKTYEEYIESLRKLKPQHYIRGKKIHPLDDPELRMAADTVGFTYKAAFMDEYKDLFRTRSDLTGEEINVFTHIPKNTDEMYNWCKVMRISTAEAGCILRCVTNDLLRSIYVTTYEMDKKYGTDYHQRFREYLRYYQKEDLYGITGMTDAGGTRALPPGKQPDPDAFVRVVEKRSDGIVIRGAKGPVAIAPCHEIIVVPTRGLREGESDYAVVCAVPADAPGVKIVVRPRAVDPSPPINLKTSAYEGMVFLDDVFVPWDRVFMCGEYDFAYRLVDLFTIFHRHTCGAACKRGFYDLLCGALICAAEANGLDPFRVGHIRDKLIDLFALGETSWAHAVAAVYEGYVTEPGVFIPAPIHANLAKLHQTRTVQEAYRILMDVASGMPVSVPTYEDYENPELKSYVEKYLKRNPEMPTEYTLKIIWLIENLLLSPWAARNLILAVHGGGHDQASRVMFLRHVDWDRLKKLALRRANISA